MIRPFTRRPAEGAQNPALRAERDQVTKLKGSIFLGDWGSGAHRDLATLSEATILEKKVAMLLPTLSLVFVGVPPQESQGCGVPVSLPTVRGGRGGGGEGVCVLRKALPTTRAHSRPSTKKRKEMGCGVVLPHLLGHLRNTLILLTSLTPPT